MGELIHGISAPHFRQTLTTRKIMGMILLTLTVPGIFGIWKFGIRILGVMAASVFGAVATEWLYEKCMKKQSQIADGRMVLSGLLLAYTLPGTAPIWLGLIGGILTAASVILCHVFIGRNLFSPVLVSRLFLSAFFKERLLCYGVDGVAAATPLAVLKNARAVDTYDMVFGNIPGMIGETSAVLLCIMGIVLILLGLIDYRVPLTCLFSFAAVLTILGGQGLSSYYLTAHLAGGGFMLALWYIVPAYSTLPITKAGRWIYGALLGILMAVFRLYGNAPEGICMAVLLGNLFVPFIEKITIPTPFGVK